MPVTATIVIIRRREIRTGAAPATLDRESCIDPLPEEDGEQAYKRLAGAGGTRDPPGGR